MQTLESNAPPDRISSTYLAQQKALHAQGLYGGSSHRYGSIIAAMAKNFNTHDILDYGCGQREIEKALGFPIRNYDPCIPEVSDHPTYPADIVVCTDVLEHIEETYLDAVLDDLKALTRRFGFFTIANFPAKKYLDDGRNAHLIQKNFGWWKPKLAQRFIITGLRTNYTKQQYANGPGEMYVVMLEAQNG